MSSLFKKVWGLIAHERKTTMAMNKDFLIAQGVPEANVEAIMAEHGKSVQAEQAKANTEKVRADGLETQLQTANTKLEGYDPAWKETMKKEKASAQEEIEKLKFGYAIEAALKENKAKNNKAVMALLDMKGLKQNGDSIVGLSEQLESIKKENDYLFESEEKPPKFVMPSSKEPNPLGGEKKEQANAALRSAFGRGGNN